MRLPKWLDESLGRLDNKVVGVIAIVIGLWFGFSLLTLVGTQFSSSLRATLSVPSGGGGVPSASPTPSPSLLPSFCTTSDDCYAGFLCNRNYECEEGCLDDEDCGLLEYCERPDLSKIGDCLPGCSDDFSCPVGEMCLDYYDDKNGEEHKCVKPPKCLNWAQTCSLVTYDHRPSCCNLKDGYEFDQFCEPEMEWVDDEEGKPVKRRSEIWGQCQRAVPASSVGPSPTPSPNGSPLPSDYPAPLPPGPIPT